MSQGDLTLKRDNPKTIPMTPVAKNIHLSFKTMERERIENRIFRAGNNEAMAKRDAEILRKTHFLRLAILSKANNTNAISRDSRMVKVLEMGEKFCRMKVMDGLRLSGIDSRVMALFVTAKPTRLRMVCMKKTIAKITDKTLANLRMFMVSRGR
jgi:hypothetical protein